MGERLTDEELDAIVTAFESRRPHRLNVAEARLLIAELKRLRYEETVVKPGGRLIQAITERTPDSDRPHA